jgi:hypothetical protein
VAVCVAADGAEVIDVAEVLGATDPVPLIERSGRTATRASTVARVRLVQRHRAARRPGAAGAGASNVMQGGVA